MKRRVALLKIDLTGQATSYSIGRGLYSGIGNFQDFMRGAYGKRANTENLCQRGL
ncbi:acetyl-CoA hydrolase/transferase C-terminal domain-containing protein [Syntrophus aciditrophicus]|uniref:CoA transferase n=1 Tax=Syntrophus aciditrophicus (strain SB) TaxID=56780 RepID=Q2LV33_SYNAS|nr:acetyl-CoA hydrolase/transferase C-terminal domain-containing protein [Syntrophus aciditrophicus]ABC77945.1 coA transferase [Syntrophus aciditrophicus SB]OPY15066.1 MAG: hypothetical protein A4E74_02262 [Syntrophus sp. PtaB.Bin075]